MAINPHIDRRWFVVQNDLLGGYAVANVDKPSSALNVELGEFEIADLIPDPAVAQHIVELHNMWLWGEL